MARRPKCSERSVWVLYRAIDGCDLMDRREFIATLGHCAASVPVLSLLSVPAQVALAREVHARVGAVYRPQALNPHQFGVVRRLAELILPQTDTPGSTEVKVAEFVDLLLAQSLMQKDKAHLLAGLEQIDVQSRAEYGGRFDELKEDEQVALLRSLDAKESVQQKDDVGGDGSARQTFVKLKALVIYGYFTSEVVMTKVLKVPIIPGRYDGSVPV